MYTTVFVLLILGGIGFPIPEEIPLLMGGIFAAQGESNIELMFLVCYLGVLVGDISIYSIGFFFGQRLLNGGIRSPFLPSITENRVQSVREGLRKNRLMCIFLGRHLFLFRSVTFVVAGSLRLSFRDFILADSVAALFSVFVFTGIGYLLGNQLDAEFVEQLAKRVNLSLLGVIVVLAAGYFIFQRFFGEKSRKLSCKADID